MNSRWTYISAALLAALGWFLVSATPAAAALGQSPTSSPNTGAESCHGYFMGPDDESVSITTDAGPNGSMLNPGQRITVTVSWQPSGSGRPEPTKVTNCVELGGFASKPLSEHVRSDISGMSHQFSYDAPEQSGTQLCDRGAVDGAGGSTDKSQILCYSIGPSAALPESSLPVLLPLGAVIILGLAALGILRRRDRLWPNSPAVKRGTTRHG